MSKQLQLSEDKTFRPCNFYAHLPFSLPVIQPKKGKKCCKKHKRGKRCKNCPKG